MFARILLVLMLLAPLSWAQPKKPNPALGGDTAAKPSATAATPAAAPPATTAPALGAAPPAVPAAKLATPSDPGTFKERVNDLVELARALENACDAKRFADEPAVVPAPAPPPVVPGPKPDAKGSKPAKGKNGKVPTAPAPAIPEPVSSPPAAPTSEEAALTTFKREVCDTLCSDKHSLNLCAFQERYLASAAVASDWKSVRALAEYIADRMAELAKTSKKTAEKLKLEAVDQTAKQLAKEGQSGVPDLAGPGLFSADAVARFASGLARFIVDRAKREGISWFLSEMGGKLCGGKAPESADYDEKRLWNAQFEIRTYWLPSFCSLAKNSDKFTGYGGGGRLFQALRSAIISDLSGWPGSSGGLALGGLFWSASGDHKGLFECSQKTKATDPRCPSLVRLRRAGATFVQRLMRGRSATTELLVLANEIDAANQKKVAGKNTLFSDELEIAACAASLPGSFAAHQAEIEAADTEKKDLARGKALLATALTSEAACWRIFGEGIERDSCAPLGGKKPGNCTSKKTALDNPSVQERLTTILRLNAALSDRADVLSEQWKRLEQAVKDYEAILKGTAPNPEPPRAADPVQLTLTTPEAAQAALGIIEERAAAAARRVQQSKAVRQLRAGLAVAHAAIDLSLDSIDMAEAAAEKKLYPGLGKVPDAKTFGGARKTFEVLARNITLIESALDEDWGAVAIGALANVRHASESALDSTRFGQSFSRYLGVITAIASERDPEKIAEAIEAAADPVGGWRRKGESGITTISLTSHAGVFAGGELRYGRYKGERQNGEAHGVLPVLALPVGLEFAWGSSCALGSPHGLFLSLLDPAAFLQYDAGDQGALPAPRPTTLLAPGIGYRLGIQGSPFSFLPFVVYRPALRAENSSIRASAANALQFGLNATVDVTIFELSSSSGDDDD